VDIDSLLRIIQNTYPLHVRGNVRQMQVKFSDDYSEVAVFIAQHREMARDSSAFYVREGDLLLFSITNLTVPL